MYKLLHGYQGDDYGVPCLRYPLHRSKVDLVPAILFSHSQKKLLGQYGSNASEQGSPAGYEGWLEEKRSCKETMMQPRFGFSYSRSGRDTSERKKSVINDKNKIPFESKFVGNEDITWFQPLKRARLTIIGIDEDELKGIKRDWEELFADVTRAFQRQGRAVRSGMLLWRDVISTFEKQNQWYD